MKKLFTTLLLLLILYLTVTYYKEIGQFIMINIIYKDELKITEGNSYEKDIEFEYVKKTDSLYPKNRQDILNIFFTALNKGWNEFTFYCPVNEYESCIDDATEITSDPTSLSYMNNLVSTYNSYKLIYFNINNFGRVNVKIDKIYSDNDINKINAEINRIYNDIIEDNMTLEEKIRTIHDYIINNTIYDQERADEIRNGSATSNISTSNTAYGPLFTGKAICGGYTDTMALFLDKLGVPNFKVASEKHIWNVVNIDGQWLHLDLTWDDPVVNTGENILVHNYFLITTDELIEKYDEQHQYDRNIYKEI